MDIRIGKVTHYYTHLSVAVVELSEELNVGDSIYFLGHTTEFEQSVDSLEINHHKVLSAGPGSHSATSAKTTEVAIKVIEPVRQGDVVFKSVEFPQQP
jgi:hypothetical protein